MDYLRQRHQHFFWLTVAIQVFNDEREIELHMFRAWLRTLYGGGQVDFGAKSCEIIARELHAKIAVAYPRRAVTIEVMEDRVCGVMLNFDAGVGA